MRQIEFLFWLITLLSLSSCSLLKRKGDWGKNALKPIRMTKISEAFNKNARNPHVWGPLIAAGMIHGTGQDEKISNWAVKEKPIFTTKENTSLWSDQNNDILLYQMYLSILLTPSMNENKSLSEFAWRKAKGGLIVNLASRSTRLARDQLAKTFRRQRPNHEDKLSFPSGHATEASSRNSLISKNLESMDIHPYIRLGVNTVNTTLAGGTLWARLEGQRHYPSDVLVGYALGTFLAGFVYDSLMNLDSNENFTLVPLGNEVTARYTINF